MKKLVSDLSSLGLSEFIILPRSEATLMHYGILIRNFLLLQLVNQTREIPRPHKHPD